MARARTQADINGFEGGVVTDRNPLEQAPNSTSAESNMVLNGDKSRSRRLGFDLEESASTIDSGVALQTSLGIIGSGVFNWKNAGGDVDKELFVVQVGTSLKVFDLDNSPVTSVVVYTEDFSSDYEAVFSYAVVDGLLVVVTGLKEVNAYSYSEGVITKTESGLLIRDLFGVDSEAGGVDLNGPQNFQVRPASRPDEHIYNLRNSTFHQAWRVANAEVLTDPITAFFTTTGLYPSASDSTIPFVFPDSTDTDNRNVDRFWPSDMNDNPASSASAIKGFFIIDALERGVSRKEQAAALRVNNPQLGYDLTSILTDTTPNGARVLSEHAGRVWYAGFSAKVVDGDTRSPRMSSYILFSRLVRDVTDIGLCYQEADPTSPVDNAIVDTDGGFIRLDGAYDIKSMVSVGNTLLVFAKNGVWAISGGDADGFKATDYAVRRVSTAGVDSVNSVVVVDGSVLFWGEESIYLLNVDPANGSYTARDITTQVIKDLYLAIPLESRKTCAGYFDKYTRRVTWVYSSNLEDTSASDQLILNIDYNAFTTQKVNSVSGSLPQIISLGESQPYVAGEVVSGVTAGGIDVVAGGEVVESTVTRRGATTRESIFLVVLATSPTITYSLGAFTDVTFTDWASLGGVDSGAFLTVNSITGGSGRFEKQVPYLTTVFRQTEDGIGGDFELTNPSSCLVSSRWGWADSANSNKWSTPRQAYRIRRPYFGPVGSFDNGNAVLTTRNKIRGSGKSVAFHFESEAGKDMHIYGWGFNLDRTDVE